MLGWPTGEAQGSPVSAFPAQGITNSNMLPPRCKECISRGRCFTLPDFCEFVSWHYPASDSFCPSVWFGEYSRDGSEPDARHHLPRPTALPAARGCLLTSLCPNCRWAAAVPMTLPATHRCGPPPAPSTASQTSPRHQLAPVPLPLGILAPCLQTGIALRPRASHGALHRRVSTGWIISPHFTDEELWPQDPLVFQKGTKTPCPPGQK